MANAYERLAANEEGMASNPTIVSVLKAGHACLPIPCEQAARQPAKHGASEHKSCDAFIAYKALNGI